MIIKLILPKYKGENMGNTIITYETFHGSAKKVAEVISNTLNCKYINIDTPFEAEDLKNIDNIILVFNFTQKGLPSLGSPLP